MNPLLEHLQPYPFERLSALKAGIPAAADYPSVMLSIGEPKHPPPDFVLQLLGDDDDQVRRRACEALLRAAEAGRLCEACPPGQDGDGFLASASEPTHPYPSPGVFASGRRPGATDGFDLPPPAFRRFFPLSRLAACPGCFMMLSIRAWV